MPLKHKSNDNSNADMPKKKSLLGKKCNFLIKKEENYTKVAKINVKNESSI